MEAGRPVVPVGTTAVRTLESLYWLAVQLEEGASGGSGAGGASAGDGTLELGQWDAYQMQRELGDTGGGLIQPAEALRRLCARASRRGETEVRGTTRLCIAPGYRFKLCDGLITNFHQPDSTLLLLVGALVGPERMREAYRHAVEQRYRFLSYGDSCLFFNAGSRLES
uniref:S-adenosylmethionine:tRNA ribosyltransferase-isomerase n=1 Tax=Zooxanthella nutricula TaxID=1333877 RepID=A0A7S2PL96_9DINO